MWRKQCFRWKRWMWRFKAAADDGLTLLSGQRGHGPPSAHAKANGSCWIDMWNNEDVRGWKWQTWKEQLFCQMAHCTPCQWSLCRGRGGAHATCWPWHRSLPWAYAPRLADRCRTERTSGTRAPHHCSLTTLQIGKFPCQGSWAAWPHPSPEGKFAAHLLHSADMRNILFIMHRIPLSQLTHFFFMFQ